MDCANKAMMAGIKAADVIQTRRGLRGAAVDRELNSQTLQVVVDAAAAVDCAKSLLLPVACRRQLFDLSDDMATKLDIEFYQDGRDALLKALAE